MLDGSVFWRTLDQLFMLFSATTGFDLNHPALLCCQVHLQQLPPFCKTTSAVPPWTSQLVLQSCNGMPLELVDRRVWVKMSPRPSIACNKMSRDITPPYHHQRCGFLPCSPIPSSRCSMAQTLTCCHALRRSQCVVVVGVKQWAYVLKLQEVIPDFSLISRALPRPSNSPRSLFVYLPWQESLFIGQLFCFQSGLCCKPSNRGSLCSGGLSRMCRLFLLFGLLQSRGRGGARRTCWFGTRSAGH